MPPIWASLKFCRLVKVKGLTLSQTTTFFDYSKMKEFADDNFNWMKMAESSPYW